MPAYDTLDVEVYIASRPMVSMNLRELDIENSGPVPISVVNITALDSTHVRVTFNQKLKNNFSLNHRENYTFIPSLSVYVATPEIAINPIYIDLTVSEMKQGQAYTLTVEELEAA